MKNKLIIKKEWLRASKIYTYQDSYWSICWVRNEDNQISGGVIHDEKRNILKFKTKRMAEKWITNYKEDYNSNSI
jgi:hypothetical protein